MSETDEPEVIAICWRLGDVAIIPVGKIPEGCMTVVRGREDHVRQAIEELTRLPLEGENFDPGTRVVPGLYEAEDDWAAFMVFRGFALKAWARVEELEHGS